MQTLASSSFLQLQSHGHWLEAPTPTKKTWNGFDLVSRFPSHMDCKGMTMRTSLIDGRHVEDCLAQYEAVSTTLCIWSESNFPSKPGSASSVMFPDSIRGLAYTCKSFKGNELEWVREMKNSQLVFDRLEGIPIIIVEIWSSIGTGDWSRAESNYHIPIKEGFASMSPQASGRLWSPAEELQMHKHQFSHPQFRAWSTLVLCIQMYPQSESQHGESTC